MAINRYFPLRRPPYFVCMLSLALVWAGGRLSVAAPLDVINPGFEDISGESPYNEFTFGPLNTVAPAFPDTKFLGIDVNLPDVEGQPKNIRGVQFREQEAGCLVGNSAGSSTGTGTRPLPCFPVDSAISCSTHSPKPPLTGLT